MIFTTIIKNWKFSIVFEKTCNFTEKQFWTMQGMQDCNWSNLRTRNNEWLVLRRLVFRNSNRLLCLRANYIFVGHLLFRLWTLGEKSGQASLRTGGALLPHTIAIGQVSLASTFSYVQYTRMAFACPWCRHEANWFRLYFVTIE